MAGIVFNRREYMFRHRGGPAEYLFPLPVYDEILRQYTSVGHILSSVQTGPLSLTMPVMEMVSFSLSHRPHLFRLPIDRRFQMQTLSGKQNG